MNNEEFPHNKELSDLKKNSVENKLAYGNPNKGVDSSNDLDNALLSNNKQKFNNPNSQQDLLNNKKEKEKKLYQEDDSTSNKEESSGNNNESSPNLSNDTNTTDNGTSANVGASNENSDIKNSNSKLKNKIGDGKQDGSGSKNYVTKFLKKKKMFLLAGLVQCLIFLIIIIGAILTVVSIAGGVVDFFRDAGNTIIGFFDNSDVGGSSAEEAQKAIDNYYKELDKVRSQIYSKYGVCIDVNLITATLTINMDALGYVEESEEPVVGESNEYSSGVSVKDDAGSIIAKYNKMTKEVGLLANMQMKTIVYGYDEDLPPTSDIPGHCKAVGEESSEELVTEENVMRFDRELSPYEWLKKAAGDGLPGNKDLISDDPNLVSLHDKTGFLYEIFAFFNKKVDVERNFEYRLWQPAAYEKKDPRTGVMKIECDDELPGRDEDIKELSIGEYTTRKESVYYWNLINSFIEEYYSEYVSDEETIIRIADDIYKLYRDLGPNNTCTIKNNYSNLAYSTCSNGITVEGVGTIDLEEYVAGVVSSEAYCSEGMEALKAQAVAARSYALNVTDNCQKAIGNSTASQTYNPNIDERAREAAYSTAGEVMVYNGKVFPAMYDSFCYQDSDCPDATKNPDGSFSVTYTKEPGKEKHRIVLRDPAQYGRIIPRAGHAHGMSQLVSYQMAKDGSSYTDILKYFYSDGISIGKSGGASITTATNIASERIDKLLLEHGSSLEEFNEYIAASIRAAGLGTRDGVATAATVLINGFEDRVGLKLPYVYGGGHGDVQLGARGDWAYGSNGLDCSSFITWAIYNGGYGNSPDYKLASNWANAGTVTDVSNGLPGDLIASDGHIQMIVGCYEGGYKVAHASQTKTGLVVYDVSYDAIRYNGHKVIDMSSYYSSHSRRSN